MHGRFRFRKVTTGHSRFSDPCTDFGNPADVVDQNVAGIIVAFRNTVADQFREREPEIPFGINTLQGTVCIRMHLRCGDGPFRARVRSFRFHFL